jgi:DNA polymerase-3 subunit delta
MIVKSFHLSNVNVYDFNYYLFYGENEGHKNELINEIFKKKIKGDVFNYEESWILINKDEFLTDLFNKSFFENDKLIIINRATDKILELIEEIFKREPEGIKCILNAQILDKRSKLRSFFEKEKKIIISAFYNDNEISIKNYVFNFLKKNDLRLSNEIINLLIEKTDSNRQILKNELEKLKNLIITKKKINPVDIAKLVKNSDGDNFFELIDFFLLKDKNKLQKILNETNLSSDNTINIVRILLLRIKKLIKIKEIIKSNNQDIEKSLNSYKPPIFWKEKEIIKKQIDINSLDNLNEFTKIIFDLEKIIKKYPDNALKFMLNFLHTENQ